MLQRSAFFMVQLSHPYMTTGKTIALTRRTFVGKVMALLFSMLSRLVIDFLARSFMAAVTICCNLGAQNTKVFHCFHCFPFICHEVMGPDTMILVFWMLSFKPIFSPSCFTFIKRLFNYSISAIKVVSSRRRKWQRTPVFLPWESQGWGRTESDMTEVT